MKKNKRKTPQQGCHFCKDGDNSMIEIVDKTDTELTLIRRIDTKAYKEKTEIHLDTSNIDALRETAKFLVNNLKFTEAKTGDLIGRSQSWVNINRHS